MLTKSPPTPSCFVDPSTSPALFDPYQNLRFLLTTRAAHLNIDTQLMVASEFDFLNKLDLTIPTAIQTLYARINILTKKLSTKLWKLSKEEREKIWDAELEAVDENTEGGIRVWCHIVSKWAVSLAVHLTVTE